MAHVLLKAYSPIGSNKRVEEIMESPIVRDKGSTPDLKPRPLSDQESCERRWNHSHLGHHAQYGVVILPKSVNEIQGKLQGCVLYPMCLLFFFPRAVGRSRWIHVVILTRPKKILTSLNALSS